MRRRAALPPVSKTPEAKVRDPCLLAAKRAGVLHKRMHFGRGAAAGWPDDLFVFEGGRHLWVEFKRPGGSAAPLQEEVHRVLRGFGGDVIVIDDVAVFGIELAKRLARGQGSFGVAPNVF